MARQWRDCLDRDSDNISNCLCWKFVDPALGSNLGKVLANHLFIWLDIAQKRPKTPGSIQHFQELIKRFRSGIDGFFESGIVGQNNSLKLRYLFCANSRPSKYLRIAEFDDLR